MLLGDGVDPTAGLLGDARAAWAELGGLGVTIGEGGYRDVDGAYAAWFAKLGAKVVLVRPRFPSLRRVRGPCLRQRHAGEPLQRLAPESARLKTRR